MKVIGICCSPRKGANTEILVNESLKGSLESGAETELLTIAKKDIKPCDGCGLCIKKGECHIKDDMQNIYQKISEADGIIFGTPVYYYSMCAQAKIIIDRLYAM